MPSIEDIRTSIINDPRNARFTAEGWKPVFRTIHRRDHDCRPDAERGRAAQRAVLGRPQR